MQSKTLHFFFACLQVYCLSLSYHYNLEHTWMLNIYTLFTDSDRSATMYTYGSHYTPQICVRIFTGGVYMYTPVFTVHCKYKCSHEWAKNLYTMYMHVYLIVDNWDCTTLTSQQFHHHWQQPNSDVHHLEISGLVLTRDFRRKILILSPRENSSYMATLEIAVCVELLPG